MIASYLLAVWRFASKGLVLRTDALQILAASVLPAAYTLLGWPMPESAEMLGLAYIAYGIGTFFVLRLISAPYFIWKEDRATIKEMARKIDAPKLHSRTIIETRLAEERVELAKSVAVLHDQITGLQSGAECISLLSAHRPRFATLFFNAEIQADWKAFENAAFAYASGFPDPTKVGDKSELKALEASHKSRISPTLDRATKDLLCGLLAQSKDTE